MSDAPSEPVAAEYPEPSASHPHTPRDPHVKLLKCPHRVRSRRMEELKKIETSLKHQKKQISEQKMKINYLTWNYCWNYRPFGTIENISKTLTPKMVNIVSENLGGARKNPEGHQWTAGEKVLAASIHKRAPKCYKLLRYAMPLPSTRTLNSFLDAQLLPLPGLNNHLFDFSKRTKRFLLYEEAYCTLMFDEMSIRECMKYDSSTDQIHGYVDMGSERTNGRATKVLVFMCKGLFNRWKQPLAFYFTKGIKGETLAGLIHEVLAAAIKAGLKVVATICDTAPKNVKALEILGASWDQPYFQHKKHKIFTIYDPPHLLKSTRNVLLRHDATVSTSVIFDGNVEGEDVGQASWQHIVATVDVERGYLINGLLYKVTEACLKPKKRSAMKVSHATYVLSNRMAAMMNALRRGGKLPQSVSGTSAFCYLFNKLFDSLNGMMDAEEGIDGLKSILKVRRENLHLDFWKAGIEKIKAIKFIKTIEDDGTKIYFTPRCQRGWQVNLTAIPMLWEHLKRSKRVFKLKSMAVGRLNMDSLQYFFGALRLHSESTFTPTVQQFTASLKTCMAKKLAFTVPSKFTNCSFTIEDHFDIHGGDYDEENYSDGDTLLTNYKTILDLFSSTSHVVAPEDELTDSHIRITVSELNKFIFKGRKGLAMGHVSGFVAQKILSNNGCVRCESALLSSHPEDSAALGFVSLREYQKTRNSLDYPSNDLIVTVGSAFTVLEEIIPQFCTERGLVCSLKANIEHRLDFSWLDNHCSEHNESIKEKILDVASKIFIHWWCRCRNKELRSKKKHKQKK